MKRIRLITIIATTTLTAAPAAAQHAEHAHHEGTAEAAPAETGNAIFAALAEVVRLLEADPATDWSRVDIEALRQHLIDMHDVMANAAVREEDIEGGLRIDVTGSGRTTAAIRRMTSAHAAQPDLAPGVNISVEEIRQARD